jgi:phage terminase large subunit-like protein
VEDVIAIRGNHGVVKEVIKSVAALDGKAVRIRVPLDAGAAASIQKEIVRELGVKGFTIYATPDRDKKGVRAGPLAAQAMARNIALCDSHPSRELCGDLIRRLSPDIEVLTIYDWHQLFLKQHREFDEGRQAEHDDIVDAHSAAYACLTNEEFTGQMPTPEDAQRLRRAASHLWAPQPRTWGLTAARPGVRPRLF